MAKQAGVSEATVSRVLNGKPGISDATRAAVLTALDMATQQLSVLAADDEADIVRAIFIRRRPVAAQAMAARIRWHAIDLGLDKDHAALADHGRLFAAAAISHRHRGDPGDEPGCPCGRRVQPVRAEGAVHQRGRRGR